MTETLEFRWIDPKERLPGVGVKVVVKRDDTAYPFEKQVVATLWEGSPGNFHWSVDGVTGWWPIPPIPEEDAGE